MFLVVCLVWRTGKSFYKWPLHWSVSTIAFAGKESYPSSVNILRTMAVVTCNSFEHDSLFSVEVPTHPEEVEDPLELVENPFNLSECNLVILLCLRPTSTLSLVHSSSLLFDGRQLALTRHTEVPASVDPNERIYGRYSAFSFFLRLLGEH